ncbi:MAG: hypothetical protein ACI84O_000836 [Myxococcota bacterium]|jgi:hypothetical protein
MLKPTPRKSTWVVRLLSVVLFFLIAWLLSFVTSDLNDVGRPNQEAVRKQHIDQELSVERNLVTQQIKTLTRQIKSSRDSLDNIKNASVLDSDREVVRFSNLLIEKELKKNELQDRLEIIEADYLPQEKQYYTAWQSLWDTHRFWVAVYKLAFIIPVFLLAALVRSRRRESAVKTIYTAILVAAFYHLGAIMHDHFPEIVFKYLAIGVGIAIVLTTLVHLLRRASAPKDLDLLKLRRESYANSICACCTFPISASGDHDYTCPGCGTKLFGDCDSCSATRHCLLPYCASCGEK